MGKVLKVQLTFSKNEKTTQTFRCPNCNTFININEGDSKTTCSNCKTNYNVEELIKE